MYFRKNIIHEQTSNNLGNSNIFEYIQYPGLIIERLNLFFFLGFHTVCPAHGHIPLSQ